MYICLKRKYAKQAYSVSFSLSVAVRVFMAVCLQFIQKMFVGKVLRFVQTGEVKADKGGQVITKVGHNIEL